ncbi:sensor histidine kinase [Halobacillus seohaensis]|uniref:histidine kinase n=1 Tax=Halobacillus seohaensis TaxID=447421 RepID=A0ABW2EIJ9_9BACI
MRFNNILPPKLWVKLTVINISLLIFIVLFTCLTIYNTACYLASNIGGIEGQTQFSFNSSLLSYSWIISIVFIIIGGLLYTTITRRMLLPVKQLTSAMETLKSGHYPRLITSKSNDEVSKLVHHFNHLTLLLQKQENERNQMLSDLSHELRTPLSNLQGYLEALTKGVIQGDQEIYKSLAEETERVNRLVQQVDEVKVWSSSASDSMVQNAGVRIDELIQQVVRLFELEFERYQIKLDLDVVPSTVFMHQEGIQQVFTNLVDNALNYNIGSEPISIVGRLQNDGYLVSVSGKGLPIPLSDKEKVFERFYRVDPSRSRPKGGTGLGLAISKEIVEHHKGMLWLETDGSYHSFYIKLPLK